MLEVKSLSVRCGALDIVKGVSFAVNDGEWLMIAGPNGAGKSTIINAVTGGVAYTGQILLNGQDIRKKKPVELAKNIGVLTQNHYVGYSFSVEEVVRLGRYAYSPGVLARRCDDDERMVELALEKRAWRRSAGNPCSRFPAGSCKGRSLRRCSRRTRSICCWMNLQTILTLYISGRYLR